MNLFAMLETSGSAMQAERMRAEVVAANMANAETTRTATGGAYHRQHVVFAANAGDPEFANTLNAASGNLASAALQPLPTLVPPLSGNASLNASGQTAPGVHIAAVVEDPSPPLRRYDPGHPDAGPDGYVSYPDINPLTEMVDLMGACLLYTSGRGAAPALAPQPQTLCRHQLRGHS